MELRTYGNILWRRKWLLIITLAVTLFVTILGSMLTAPLYAAEVKLQIATAARGSLGDVQYDLNYSDRLMNTYIYMAQSGPVKQELLQQLKLATLPAFTVEVIPNTELMRIGALASDARLASELVNTLAQILIQKGEQQIATNNQDKQQTLDTQLTQLEQELAQAQQQYDQLLTSSRATSNDLSAALRMVYQKRDLLTALIAQAQELKARSVIQTAHLAILDPAIPAIYPARPNWVLNLVLGCISGLVAGLGLVFLFENLDNTLHSVEQIERITQMSPLIRIPETRSLTWPTGLMNHHPAHEEAFARLEALLTRQTAHSFAFTLLVTSAQAYEGKSTVVANLAVAMSKMGRSVLVVDGNLHHPTQHEIFNLPNRVGLSDVLQRRMKVDQVVYPTILPNLRLIPSGLAAAEVTALLTPFNLDRLFKHISPGIDIILVDTPPFLAVNDTALLAQMCDGVLLVVGQSIAQQSAVKVASQQLNTLANKFMGVVINRASQYE